MIVRKYGVQLVKESSTQYPLDKRLSGLTSTKEIAINIYAGMDREMLSVFMLDTKNKIIGYNIISVGCLSKTLVHPREVFKAAILANASKIILVHNHPSGDSEPSHDDIITMKRMKDAGNLIGIELLDSLIVADDECLSMKEQGTII